MDTAVPFTVTVNNVTVRQSLCEELMWNHLQGAIHDVNQGTCRGNDRLVQTNMSSDIFSAGNTYPFTP